MESKMRRFHLTILNACLLIGFLGVTTLGAFGASEQSKRLGRNIEDSETFVLKGPILSPIANGVARAQGEGESPKAMPKKEIHFAMTSAQQADLQQLQAAQQNRHSAQYHKFLTPEEYAARFGLNTEDIQKVSAWLESNGFGNVQ